MNFAGQFQVGNYACPSWELARDPYVRLAGAEFTDGPLPPWIEAWKGVAVSRPTAGGKRPHLCRLSSHMTRFSP